MSAALLLAPGMLFGLGVVLTALAFRPRQPRLADALAVLADRTPLSAPQPPAQGAERLGAWWLRARNVAASPGLERQLTLRGRTLAAHYTRKLTWGLTGLLLPLVAGLAGWLLLGWAPVLPGLTALVLAAAGFFAPDLLLRGGGQVASHDATEALLTFFDLVTLERLANQSATQSLHAAATLSDVPVFAAIRGTLDRARLQQRTPHADLRELGRELDLPALSDLADVMHLDESGAALSSALRARVRELRDAHLTGMKVAASDLSERMTLWMVIPSLVFGLFFLVPPLLTLVGAG